FSRSRSTSPTATASSGVWCSRNSKRELENDWAALPGRDMRPTREKNRPSIEDVFPFLVVLCGAAAHIPIVTAQTAGTFIPTGNMTTPRSGHTATLLTSGKVLIAGGSLGFSALPTAELYDSDRRTFTRTGDMTTPRSRHTATL